MPADIASPYSKLQRPKWRQRIVPYGIATVLAAMAGTAIVGISRQFASTPDKSLAVVTEPPGATIYVDGQKHDGVSNAALTLKPGKHKVRVEMPGFAVDGSAEREIDLAGSDAPERVAFKLVADPTTPTGAQGLIGQDPPAEPSVTASDAAEPRAAVETAAPSEIPAVPSEIPAVPSEIPAATATAAAADTSYSSPTATNREPASLQEEVEKLKTTINIMLQDQAQYAARSELRTEIGRLENEVAALKSELQALRSKETSVAKPLAKADTKTDVDQQQWRAYSGGGVVTITNLMPNTLVVRIAGISYTLESGGIARAEGLKPGQVTTEIVGHEAPRVWELSPPKFRQDLVIK